MRVKSEHIHIYIYIYIQTHHYTTQACIHSTKGNNPTIELGFNILMNEYRKNIDDRFIRICFLSVYTDKWLICKNRKTYDSRQNQ
jgi:hypothetical protein